MVAVNGLCFSLTFVIRATTLFGRGREEWKFVGAKTSFSFSFRRFTASPRVSGSSSRPRFEPTVAAFEVGELDMISIVAGALGTGEGLDTISIVTGGAGVDPDDLEVRSIVTGGAGVDSGDLDFFFQVPK